jgi:hypothetical protein
MDPCMTYDLDPFLNDVDGNRGFLAPVSSLRKPSVATPFKPPVFQYSLLVTLYILSAGLVITLESSIICCLCRQSNDYS